MTAIITNQVAVDRIRLLSPNVSALILGRSIGRLLKTCGRGFVDASSAYAQARALVFVKPGGATVERQRLALDIDGEGRDPSW